MIAFLYRYRPGLERAWARLVAFAGPPVGSLLGHLNRAELLRVAVALLASGGGAQGLLAAVANDPSAFLDPTTPALAIALAIGLADAYRRTHHGAPLLRV